MAKEYNTKSWTTVLSESQKQMIVTCSGDRLAVLGILQELEKFRTDLAWAQHGLKDLALAMPDFIKYALSLKAIHRQDLLAKRFLGDYYATEEGKEELAQAKQEYEASEMRKQTEAFNKSRGGRV